MKYKDPVTGELKDIIIKSGDTLPIGTIVEIQGDVIPDGYEEVNGSNYVVENTDALLTNVVSRNIYKPELNSEWVRNSCSVTLDNDEYTFVSTGTDMYLGNVTSIDNIYEKTRGKLIEVIGGKALTIVPTNAHFNAIFVTSYDSDKKSLGYSRLTSSSYQIPNNAKYIVIRFGVNPATSGTTYKTKLLVSYDKDTTYSPYLNLQELQENNNNNNIINYSTNEQVIGTWMNKPLYRKVIQYKNSSIIGAKGTSTEISIPHGISNLEQVIECKLNNVSNQIFPRVGNNSSVISWTGIINVTSTAIILLIVNDTWISKTWYITLEYTKTTD